MATFEQERHVELVSGTSEKFIITNRMVSADIPDQLPHLNVFVLTITDRDDAKDDVLTRIARISDLTTLPQSRDLALATGSGTGIEFLSSSVVTLYSTLSEATAASTAIKDRVNKLIEDWIAFGEDFNAPDPDPASYILPTSDATQLEALINAYKLAKQSRYQLQLAETEADAVLSRATTAYTTAAQRYADLAELVALATTVSNEMELTQDYLQTLIAAGNEFASIAAALVIRDNTGAVDAPAQASLDASRALLELATNVAANQDLLVANYVIDASTLLSNLSALLSAYATDKATASTELAAAQAAQITAEQSVTSMTATETSALAAVMAVCPDFVYTSIALVDDVEEN